MSMPLVSQSSWFRKERFTSISAPLLGSRIVWKPFWTGPGQASPVAGLNWLAKSLGLWLKQLVTTSERSGSVSTSFRAML